MDYEIQNIPKGESFIENIHSVNAEPLKKYKVNATILGEKGEEYSACIVAVCLDENKNHLKRYVKWINDFSKNFKDYLIIFKTPENTAYIVIGYRINVETLNRSDVVLKLPQKENFTISEAQENDKEQYDDVPPLSNFYNELTKEEENIIESKMIWILGSPRSGTTWLTTQLLNLKENVVWNEPFIGKHLDCMVSAGFENGPIFDNNYFFSDNHKAFWLPALRKLILARAYSQSLNLINNIVIKEPSGAGTAKLLMECLPRSKMIFLLRDGRDVIDSILDARRPEGSWAMDAIPLTTENQRAQAIRQQAKTYLIFTENCEKAYNLHDPKLRLLVKYEELMKNTFSEIKRIYDFIGIKMSDVEVEKIVEKYSFEKIPKSKKGSGKFFRFATPGSWRVNLSYKEQKIMNSILSKTLERLGYKI